MGQTSVTDERRRDSVFLLAKIVGEAGEESRRARNLSAEGVCIEQPEPLEPGTKLTLSIGMVERIQAEVMWTRNGMSGLKFGKPIDTALARKRPPQSLDPKVGWGHVNAL